MKKVLSGLLILSVTTLSAKNLDTVPKVTFENLKDSASYALGASIGQTLQQRFAGANIDLVMATIKDVFNGKGVAFDQNQQNQIINEYMMGESGRAAKAEKDKGIAFLADNKTKEGVKTTASGLQYKVLRPGTGAKPKATDNVKVHYEGRLLSGEVFDGSYQRGQPAEFPLNGVIPGWTEGVQLMEVGSKFQFYIPSDLAYGDMGQGGTIKPGATLVFDVELLEIKKAAAPSAQPNATQTKPASKPAAKPTAKPAAKPAAKPVKRN